MNEHQRDTYYSERRAVSREMRRREQNRKLLVLVIITAIMVVLAVAVRCAAKAPTIEAAEVAEVFSVQTVEPTAEPTKPVATPAPTPCPYTDQDLEMLAMVIYQEAGGDACSDETRRMVGEVVLNRVADPRFPDTLYGVLTQPYQYGRLAWRFDWPERAVNPGEKHAVERAYRIAILVLTSTDRLLPEDVVFQAEFAQGTETVAFSNGLYFCR